MRTQNKKKEFKNKKLSMYVKIDTASLYPKKKKP